MLASTSTYLYLMSRIPRATTDHLLIEAVNYPRELLKFLRGRLDRLFGFKIWCGLQQYSPEDMSRVMK
jgi:hypothetical protein